jgi:DeoR/GlpR family transcriptional regulator of sugar metabolism
VLALLDRQPDLTGRELAELLGVHESTTSRDLKFINQVREDFRRTNFGAEMRASSFAWLRAARGYQLTFLIRNGVRVL